MTSQHGVHAAILPQVIAAVREEVGGVLTEDQILRAAKAAMVASLSGLHSAAVNGLIPTVGGDAST